MGGEHSKLDLRSGRRYCWGSGEYGRRRAVSNLLGGGNKREGAGAQKSAVTRTCRIYVLGFGVVLTCISDSLVPEPCITSPAAAAGDRPSSSVSDGITTRVIWLMCSTNFFKANPSSTWRLPAMDIRLKRTRWFCLLAVLTFKLCSSKTRVNILSSF